jgi:hypothetical protein
MAAIVRCQSVTGADVLFFSVFSFFLCVLCVRPLKLARKDKGLTQRTQRKEEGAENLFSTCNLTLTGAELLCSFRVENHYD